MKTLTDHLAQYAAYHRDARNIATHFVGIPMIVLALAVLLSRASWQVAGHDVSAALIMLLSAGFYLRLDLVLGLIMTGLVWLAVWFGAWAAAQSLPVWAALGFGGFVVGWVFQFVGHHYEGRKPAFVDDLMGLLVGPLFVLAELLFGMGFYKALQAQVEQIAGPVRGRSSGLSA